MDLPPPPMADWDMRKANHLFTLERDKALERLLLYYVSLYTPILDWLCDCQCLFCVIQKCCSSRSSSSIVVFPLKNLHVCFLSPCLFFHFCSCFVSLYGHCGSVKSSECLFLVASSLSTLSLCSCFCVFLCCMCVTLELHFVGDGQLVLWATQSNPSTSADHRDVKAGPACHTHANQSCLVQSLWKYINLLAWRFDCPAIQHPRPPPPFGWQ